MLYYSVKSCRKEIKKLRITQVVYLIMCVVLIWFIQDYGSIKNPLSWIAGVLFFLFGISISGLGDKILDLKIKIKQIQDEE